MNSRLYLIVIVLVGLCGLSACTEPEDDTAALERFIDEKVQERIDNYRTIFFRQCGERVIEQASVMADSILILEARMKRDTALKPPKPDKPLKPLILSPTDTIPVKPLFEDSITN